ncbi:MAG: hypothetical protein IH571_05020 [Acholeplasmataceae bacterium]|nr:hypothetical protein [Acholeplasmataceae bacterium]
MNDYELIYLIRNERDHIAQEFLFRKYHKFIWKHVHLLNENPKEHDDLHQEGLMMLQKAVETYDERRGKSFTRYFELILRRQLYAVIKQLPRHMLFGNTDFHKGVVYLEEDPPEVTFSSDLETQVYELYFLQRFSVTQIAFHTEYTKKQIYNTIYRVKEKYKNML